MSIKKTKRDIQLTKLMTTQLKLSIKLFSILLIILLGTPLLCYLYPNIVNVRLFGFPLNWLFLGVIFYPLTWFIAWIYVKKSIALEEDLISNKTWEGDVNLDSN